MKKIISVLLVISMALPLSACGDSKVIEGKEYDTYGLFNKESKYNPKIEYDLIVGNVVWSVLLVETAVFPIYFLGFSLWEPVGLRGDYEPGVINQ